MPALYDRKYDGMSMEEVYDLLYENADKINIEDLVDQLMNTWMKMTDKVMEGSHKKMQMVTLLVNQSTAKNKARNRDNIKESLLQSAAGASAGEMPAGVKRIIKILQSLNALARTA